MNVRSLQALPRAALVLIAVLAAAPRDCQAQLIRIENVRWGFDGNVVPQAFNPLSCEVYNDSPDPAEVALKLQRSNGIQPVDAPIVRPLFLAGNSGVRVQFFPYVISGWSDWSLEWGRGPDQRMSLTAETRVTLGEPATVILYDPDALVAPGGGGLPRFDETFFPISVSGTTGLAGVVLDHNPRHWYEVSQKGQAFLDWLHAGGTLHLLQSSEGGYPTFQAPLDELNAPLDEFRVGAGLVIRHAITIRDLDRDYALERMTVRHTVQLPTDEEAEGDAQTGQQVPMNYSYVNWDTAQLMFTRLKRMTLPDHNWPLIYLMALIYLLVIFPGCWLIGRRRADYRITYGVMLGAVVLFSMGFKTVGQRGYGEETALHAMAIARPLPEGRVLLQQWANLFVTNGDDYRVSHRGDGLLFSSGQSDEAVRGVVINPPAPPPGGQLNVDIPPFSARTIAHAGVIEFTPFDVHVEAFEADESLRTLRVSLNPEILTSIQEAHVLYRGRTYTLNRDGEQLVLRGGGREFAQFLNPESWQQWDYGMTPFGWGDDVEPEELFATSMRPLIARSMGVHDEETQHRVELANDRARLFVYADMPEELFPACEYIEGTPVTALRRGRVLYVIDVFPPDDGV